MQTKIIATLGPASAAKEEIKRMLDEGMDGCRFNFSHGTHEEHLEKINFVKEISVEEDVPISLIGDLQGPKIRIGEVENNSVMLVSGQELLITTRLTIGTSDKVSIGYDLFPSDVEVGEKLLVDDGKILLEVIETNNLDLVKTRILQGGELKSRKGVNLPNTRVSIPSLTEKDIHDLEFAIANKFDWIALSFVRSAKDVVQLRKKIIEIDPNCSMKIMSKIEKPGAIQEIDHIIRESDALIVARGDLGLELPIERVPSLQKKIIRKCLDASCPVIVATQMMESMIENITPTRAEVSDVANSILDGVDALLLSGETSVGRHPFKVIQMVQSIMNEMETNQSIYYKHVYPDDQEYERFITDSTLFNAAEMAQQTGAKAITAMTNSGYSAFVLSSQRPGAQLYIFTNNPALPGILNILWGVQTYLFNAPRNTDRALFEINSFLKNKGLMEEGQIIVNLASIPVEEMGMTNMMKLSRIH